jgi:hypothetical protein
MEIEKKRVREREIERASDGTRERERRAALSRTFCMKGPGL